MRNWYRPKKKGWKGTGSTTSDNDGITESRRDKMCHRLQIATEFNSYNRSVDSH
jgi:hypothetical protein